ADIARTLSEERGDGADAEVLAWAEALRAAVESHVRDLDATMPWARRVAEAAVADLAAAGPEPASVWAAIEPLLASLPTLAGTPERCQLAIDELTAVWVRLKPEDAAHRDALTRIDALVHDLGRAAAGSAALVRRLSSLARRADTLFAAMEFGFLFDATRKLFSIGYRVADSSLDPSCYDLLASEARLTSFIAIAKGDVPAAHWFHLGRALTPVDRGSALVSWSGSMFEYLMPALVMRSPSGSLL